MEGAPVFGELGYCPNQVLGQDRLAQHAGRHGEASEWGEGDTIFLALRGFRGVDEDIDDLVTQQSLLPKSAYLGSSSYVPVRS